MNTKTAINLRTEISLLQTFLSNTCFIPRDWFLLQCVCSFACDTNKNVLMIIINGGIDLTPSYCQGLTRQQCTGLSKQRQVSKPRPSKLYIIVVRDKRWRDGTEQPRSANTTQHATDGCGCWNITSDDWLTDSTLYSSARVSALPRLFPSRNATGGPASDEVTHGPGRLWTPACLIIQTWVAVQCAFDRIWSWCFSLNLAKIIFAFV